MQGNLISNRELCRLVERHVISIKPFEQERAQLAHYPLDPEIFFIRENEQWIPAHSFAKQQTPFILEPNQYVQVEIRQHVIPEETRQPVSLWGTECDHRQEHFLLASEALPSKERFAAFLDRQFEAHSWVDASKRYAEVCPIGGAAEVCPIGGAAEVCPIGGADESVEPSGSV